MIRAWMAGLPMLLMCGLVALAGCDTSDGAATVAGPRAAGAGPYQVVTTVGMVTDVVRQVAGEKAEVRGLIGEGIDPHLYKPTRDDVAALMKADVVFYNGLLLEGKMADVLARLADGGRPVHAVTRLLDSAYLATPADGGGGHHDPHVWMDPAAWISATQAVAEALTAYDPTHADAYRANAAAYVEQLKQLDVYAKQVIGSIPKERRVLVTAHDAFGYFGRAYDVEVLGIQGISTESEAGLQDLRRLIDVIAERDVRAVFVETSVADKNVRALVDGAAARGKKVVIGGSLYSDAMGPAGTYEGTYVGMIDHNVTTIARALGGEAPARGMQGKLAAAAGG